MILTLLESDFIDFENNDKNKLTNFFNLKDVNIERPFYENDNDEYESSMLVKELLLPSLELEIVPIYKQNIKIKHIKCLDDKIYKQLLKQKE